MEISLSSSLNAAKPLLSTGTLFAGRRISQAPPPPRRYTMVSCNAGAAAAASERAAERKDFYKVLSLSSKKAGMDEIKRAYRAMALKYHPDVCHDPSMKEESERMFVELHEAYKTLSDPDSREQYDRRLSLGDLLPNYKVDFGCNCNHHRRFDRSIWEGQVLELRRRSSFRAARKEGSWASRLRARNRENGFI